MSLYLLMLGFFAHAKDIDILKAGAKADGVTVNTKIIQKAIDAVSASGGGKVIIPPGNFMTGTLFMKSGVNLHIMLGAVLLGSHSTSDYAKGTGKIALIYAKGQHTISITGPGIIDGQGQELMFDIFAKLRSGEMTEDSIWLYKRPGSGRSHNVYFNDCKNIVVRDITLKNSSNWVQDYRGCDGILIEGMKVQSTAYWNNDGLDVTDSKNVIIRNSYINASDDGICLKSEDKESLCENITIENCIVRSSANGFKLGTAGLGGFRNIKVNGLTVFDTYRSAIALELVDGGVLENVDIRNVIAKNTGNAIFIRLGKRNTDERVGVLQNVYIANVKAEIPLLKPDQGYPIEGPPDHLRPGFDQMPVRPSHYHIYGHPFLPYNLIPSSIVGIPGNRVKNIKLENIDITYGGKADSSIAYIPLDKVESVIENINGYPEFSMFGELPSWGFYIRHAEGIEFKNVKLRYKQDDFRPAIVMDDVHASNFNSIDIPTAKKMPMIYLHHTDKIDIQKLSIPFSEKEAVLKHENQ